ncbi:Sel1 repeat-containing protein [Nitrospirillum amazonense]|uniref:Sel1 repeat-containing protein n=1 Tax=Nitrospirillum amazonense TaxID=28077 RepID=A0A560FI36_9PROT|nr:SEL1-like repeat protein [Nitrospirillum amazonense]TWB21273.1 Sel1 repeat-containing protein [Nitrospirillum amazonense]
MPLPPYIPALALLLLTGTALAAPDAPPPTPPTAADAGLLALDARARAGDAQAQLDLADAYGDVPFDRPTDVARASAWYRLAAAAPDTDIRRQACAALGTLEAGGMGWPENISAALPWYRCAADLGDTQSQFNLALLYDEGVDIPADTPQAVRWYRRAAEGGLVLALERLGALAERDHDRDGAARLYGEAAAKGDIAAAQALARLKRGEPSPQVVGMGLAAQSQDPATVKPPPKPVPGQPRTPPAAVGGDGLRLIQRRLRDLGYLHGPADGRLGARTANAILAYEVAHPAVWDETAPPPDGWPSRDLLARLARH